MADHHCTRRSQPAIAGHWLGITRPRPMCSLDGCDRPRYARGYCPTHYHQLWATGKPTRTLGRAKGTTCTATGCTEEARARGLCRQHYNRWCYLNRRGAR